MKIALISTKKIIRLIIKLYISLVIVFLLMVAIVIGGFYFYSYHSDFFENSNLPGGYQISEFAKVTNAISRECALGRYFIFEGVVDYDTAGDYILLLNMDIIIHDALITYTDKKSYWAINYKKQKLIGPMDDVAFYWFRRNNNLLSVHLHVPDYYWRNVSKDEATTKTKTINNINQEKMIPRFTCTELEATHNHY